MLKYFIKNWYTALGLIIFFYIILFKVDLKKIIQIVAQANLWIVGLVVVLNLLMIMIQAWRWNWLKKIQNINYKYKDSFLFF
ncbi:flippase-like domain-containing protein, partial [Patescibacteria group bacterium]|nr:flippase-like domain-containing protein [Patescibacteria group bacterium]